MGSYRGQTERRPDLRQELGMRDKRPIKTFLEMVCTAYRNALTQPPQPLKTPTTTEEIQERERYKAERYLESMRHRMPL